MKQLLTSTLYFIFFAGLSAQPTLEWQKNYGGTRYESAQFIEMATDGNYFVAGYTTSNNNDVDYHIGSDDCWILKMTPTGQILWQKTMGGSEPEVITNFKATADGGCIFSVLTSSKNVDLEGIAPDDYPVWVVKLDADSETEWQRFFESSYANDAVIIQTSDGGFVLAGQVFYNSDGTSTRFTKLNPQGVTLWEKDIHTHDYHSCQDLVSTPDGGYLMAGQVSDNSTFGLLSGEWWIAKLNANFEITWDNLVSGNSNEVAQKILISPDGSYLVAGVSSSNTGFFQDSNGGQDIWLVKYDGNGSIVWKNNFGGSNTEYFADIEDAGNGNILLLAGTRSANGDVSFNHGIEDFWLVKLNSLGTLQWEATFGGSFNDLPSDGILLPGRQYLMVGSTGSLNGDVLENYGYNDLWLAKTIIID